MKTTLRHSAVAILAILLGQIFLSGCDERTAKAELSAMNFQGDATLEYIKRPALLGSDGILLNLEQFNLSEGLDRVFVLKNIPALKQPYALFFPLDEKLGKDISTNLLIETSLQDSKGVVQWNIKAPLSDWTGTEKREKHETEYFYMLSTKTGVVECAFTPSPNTEYRLHIKCTVINPAILATVTNKNVHFCLRAGGYK